MDVVLDIVGQMADITFVLPLCNVIYSVCDVIDTALHRYRCVCHLCDDTDTVAVVSRMVGEMAGIVIVLS